MCIWMFKKMIALQSYEKLLGYMFDLFINNCYQFHNIIVPLTYNSLEDVVRIIDVIQWKDITDFSLIYMNTFNKTLYIESL